MNLFKQKSSLFVIRSLENQFLYSIVITNHLESLVVEVGGKSC